MITVPEASTLRLFVVARPFGGELPAHGPLPTFEDARRQGIVPACMARSRYERLREAYLAGKGRGVVPTNMGFDAFAKACAAHAQRVN